MTRAFSNLVIKVAVLLTAVCALSLLGSRGITPTYAGGPRVIVVNGTADCTSFTTHSGTVGDPDIANCIRGAIIDANANPGSTISFDPATNGTPQLLTLNNCVTPPAPCVPGVDGGDPTINDIDVTASVTIIGNAPGGLPVTIIDGNGLDKIFSFNPSEAAPSCTPATGIQVTLQNLQLQNGKNQRAFSTDCDSEGGAFDFDAGVSGSGTLSLTNLTITANQTLDGDGGAIALFEGGTVSINGSRITNNHGRGNISATVGGGIFVGSNLNATASNLTITDSSLTGNTMTGNVSPDGGAIYMFNNTGGGSTSYALRSVTISNNSARQGGGIVALEPITINNAGSLGPSVISGNSSITTACSPSPCGTTGDGGGLYLNGSGTNSITKAKITGNSTAGHGGGIAVGTTATAALTMIYSRLAGNTATLGGSNQFDATAATLTVTDNWWGTNSPAGTISNTGGGTTSFDPFITLVHTASPSTIRINQSSTLTASMNQDNHNAPIGAANLDVINGLPITFNNAVLGTIPQAQPESLDSNGLATATFNAGSTGGQGHADAVVDQATVTADIVVLQPPSITKSFAPPKIVLNTGVSTMTLGITNPNVVPINASFTDTFPSGIVVAAAPNSSNTCGSTFTPIAGATSVTWTNASLPVGSCTIKVDVKGTLEGVLTNSVTIDSTDAGNGNTPSADLTVYIPPVLAIAKNHVGTFTQGSTATWTLQVSNTASSSTAATDGTTVTVSDALPSGYAMASFTGSGWSCLGSATVTCTSTAVVAGNGGSFPLITLTVNVPPASPTSVSNTGKVFGGGDAVHVDLATAATGLDSVTVVQVPASMVANAGTTPQSAAISTAFAVALGVTVTDAGSVPVSGVTVTFTAPAQSGASGLFSNSTGLIGVVTNASGIASAPFTANANAGGPYNVAATVSGAPTVNFALTNTVGAPSQMTANAGTTPQSATVSTAFAVPLGVTVKDAGNNPVPGVSVTFTAPGSGASGIFSNSTATITVATNASGVATASFTANATAGGSYNVAASASGLTTVNFSLTNTAGGATTMTANAGTTPQSAAVTTAFAVPLGVTVKDGSNNPVPGVNVTFTAPGSGASGVFSNSTATITVPTNASGVATAPFTANGIIGGPYNVAATASGLTTVNFVLTNTVGSANQMTANAGTTPQSATVSTAFAVPLGVTVKDAGNNPVPGVSVTFTAPGSGASGIFSNSTATITVATNASGVASAPFTANALAGGPYNVAASASGLTTVNFVLTNTAGGATTMTANAGTTPQSATVSTAFAVPLGVTVKDAGNNPVAGVNVTFTAPGSGASGTFSNSTATITVATNASGVASAPFTANGTAGGPYTVTAAATGLTTVNFALTNTSGPVTTATYTVSKDFTDNSTGSATINIACTNATPDALSKPAKEVPATPAVFNLSNVVSGAVCTVTESPIAGYTQQSTTCVPNTTFAGGDAKSCQFVNAPVVAPSLLAPTLTKTFGSAAITLGGSTTLTFTVVNPNAVPLTNLAFSDNLPGIGTIGGGIVLATPTGLTPAVAPCGGTFTGLAGGSSLSLTGGTVPANGSCTFSVNVYAFREGVVSNSTSTVTSSAPVGVAATATATATIAAPIGKGIPVVSIPNVSAPQLLKAFDPSKTNPFLPLNTPVAMTFTLTNANTVFALTGMGFTDNMPAGMVVATPNGLVNNCAGAVVTAVAGTSTITVTGASLASLTSCTITVNVMGTATGSFTNQTTAITSLEGGIGNNAQAGISIGAVPHKGL